MHYPLSFLFLFSSFSWRPRVTKVWSFVNLKESFFLYSPLCFTSMIWKVTLSNSCFVVRKRLVRGQFMCGTILSRIKSIHCLYIVIRILNLRGNFFSNSAALWKLEVSKKINITYLICVFCVGQFDRDIKDDIFQVFVFPLSVFICFFHVLNTKGVPC